MATGCCCCIRLSFIESEELGSEETHEGVKLRGLRNRSSMRDRDLGFGGDEDDRFAECKLEEFGKDEEEESATTRSSGLTE